MKKPIVLGIGEFLWDILPSGKKAGGAPVNFAYHASQNGAEGWGISAIGDDDLGRELLTVTHEYGINLAVETVPYPTGTVQISLHDGIPEYTICENVAWDHIIPSPEAIKLAEQASAISFGTLAQRSADSRNATRKLVSYAPKGALIIYDINLRQHFFSKEIIEDSLSIANILKINDEEIEVIKPLLSLKGLDNDAVCAYLMSRYHLDIVVLTGGDKFSSVYSSEGISTIETPKVEVADTVGAGDAFSGAFVGSLLAEKSVREAHENAVKTAAYVCTQSGAWVPKQK